jgi:hypothetical protein
VSRETRFAPSGRASGHEESARFKRQVARRRVRRVVDYLCRNAPQAVEHRRGAKRVATVDLGRERVEVRLAVLDQDRKQRPAGLPECAADETLGVTTVRDYLQPDGEGASGLSPARCVLDSVLLAGQTEGKDVVHRDL